MLEYGSLRNGLFGVNALLPTAVYNSLYDYAAKYGPKTVVEIGAADGASAIALALGCKDNGHSSKLYSIDVFRSIDKIPSSRQSFGNVEENVARVKDNLVRAGVQDYVEIFAGSSDEFAASRNAPQQIDFLVLDADGRVDRDILLYGDLLAEDALVIIDDIDGVPTISRVGGEDFVDLKHVISARILDEMIRVGYLELEKKVGRTAFCRAIKPSSWDTLVLHKIFLISYRDLVFTKHSTALGNWRKRLIRYSKRSKKFVKLARTIRGRGFFRE